MSAPVIHIEDFSLEFPTYHGPVRALDRVTIDVGPGEIVGIVGESGCGKSVTAMSVMRLLPPEQHRVTGGRILVLDHQVLALSEPEMQDIRGDEAAMVFQEPMNALNPTMRVARQIVQVIRRHRAMSEHEAHAHAETLLADMRIADPAQVMASYPFELSGGMRQRVLLAMAFSCNPRVLIADEPTTALDVTVQAQVLALMKEKAAETGASILLITHDMGVVAQLCDRVHVMYAGQVVEHGSAARVLGAAQHPYTQALLRSLPEMAAPKVPLATIPGTVPNLIDPPSGCRFRSRCAFAHERCTEPPPSFAARDPGPPDRIEHRAACWLLDPESAVRENETAAHEAGRQTAAAGAGEAQTLIAFSEVAMRFPVGTDWLGRPRAEVHALNAVDLAVRRGETLGIVGESGCGKSTLGQLAMGLLRPSTGRVLFEGHDINALAPAALRALRKRFQVVFQDPQSSLDPRMPTWRIIAEPLMVRGLRAPGRLRARAVELAELVGLAGHQLDRYPHEFSGGQRQRIAIARALASEPDLIVLDEPTSALDVSVQAQILNLLLRLQAELGLTYVFISHDVSVVRHLADRVAVMYLGQVVELGPAETVLEQPSHPYTRTLVSAVPKLSGGMRLEGLKRGQELPSNITLPQGCFFQERCPFSATGCERPQILRTDALGREVRCHRHAEIDRPVSLGQGAGED